MSVTIEAARATEWNDRTRAEARVVIAQQVGLHTRPGTPFGLAELNSIHAFVAGAHAVPKRDLYLQSCGRVSAARRVTHADLRGAVVRAVRQALQDADALTEIDAMMLTYDPGPAEASDRVLNLPALQRIARYCERHRDQRAE